MKKLILLVFACSGIALLRGVAEPPEVSAPEIDASSAAAAVTVLIGGLAIIRSRQKR